ncbi:MAG: hypothetical protein WCX31_07230 [Salinivirgaceae bacterium]
MNKLSDSLTGIFIVLISLLFAQCQVPYENDNLEANAKIPVVNGVLSNLNGLQSFDLYYAMPYNNNRLQRIAWAQVFLNTDSEDSYPLLELTPGRYSIDKNSVSFNFGTGYFIEVRMPDGSLLKSETMILNDTIGIDKVFYDFNQRITVVEDLNGNFNQVTQQGIFIYLKMNPPKRENVYYRAMTDYYVHSQVWVNEEGGFQVDCTFYQLKYKVTYDTLFDVLEGVSNTDFPNIGNISNKLENSASDLTVNTIFLPADPECRNFSEYTSNTFIEWIFPVDLITTSVETYNYYSEAKQQLNPTDRIFDPIPQQLYGNIYSETDANSPALGLFDVVSVSRRYYAVYVDQSYGYRSYQGRFYTDTVIKGGWYPNLIYVDTTFVDTVFPENPSFNY